jgi:hypothetical protein
MRETPHFPNPSLLPPFQSHHVILHIPPSLSHQIYHHPVQVTHTLFDRSLTHLRHWRDLPGDPGRFGSVCGSWGRGGERKPNYHICIQGRRLKIELMLGAKALSIIDRLCGNQCLLDTNAQGASLRKHFAVSCWKSTD